ncbi:ribonuclease E activity regulator RraA [Amycolatopsis sp. NPDC005232]|uniref:ribonuclease E activity regulator RraA n=1 Tax=Amycolatopsis sp. NPDC005232 TaxID=3157027 RepID=UPI0033A4072C
MTTTPAIRLSTADLADEYGEAAEVCEGGFSGYGGRDRFAGRVVTVLCHEDTRLARATLSEPGEGRVLVVDGGGSLRRALFGDVSAALAIENGWSGVVFNGAVRDTETLRKLDLGVLARGACPRRGSTTGAGERDLELVFAGAHVRPGDYLVADADGFVCLPEPPVVVDAEPVAQDHPYRPAVVAGDLVHVSGALGVDRDGVAVAGRRAALDAAMDRLAERLATVGGSLGDLVKCTYYVTDVSLRTEANEQYRDLFPGARPARTFLEVAALPYGAIVEIDGLAVTR